jgi:hypothetical protein
VFITKNMLQEDYREFAENYLGIDYEDYVNLLNDVDFPKEEIEFEFQTK